MNQLEKDIAFCIDEMNLGDNEIGEMLRACEKLGGIGVEYFCEEFIFVDEEGEAQMQWHDDDYLNIAAELLPEDPYDEKTWDVWTDLIKNQTGKKGKELFMPIRFALTGRNKGPELKYLLPLLTKKHILKKLGNI